jgi:DNA-3-methyladenine glycosylase I
VSKGAIVTLKKTRCRWTGDDPLYITYHDTEWGVPLHDDRKLFEFLILEGAQAGLSWITILKKRQNYRKAFQNFDPRKVAGFDSGKVKKLLSDPGIVRNRLKIEAAIQNANAFLAVRKEFGTFDICAYEQGSQEKRLSIRGAHHLLRLHAGGGDGQRPHGRLFPV